MRTFLRFFMAAMVLCSIDFPETAEAQSGVVYVPNNGDIVLLFTHQLIPDFYEEGRRVIIEGFSDVLDAHNDTDGGDRLTYWLEDPENPMVLGISFFHSDARVDAWLASPHRLAVLEELPAQGRGWPRWRTEGDGAGTSTASEERMTRTPRRRTRSPDGSAPRGVRPRLRGGRGVSWPSPRGRAAVELKVPDLSIGGIWIRAAGKRTVSCADQQRRPQLRGADSAA